MALTRKEYTGNGSTTLINVDFDLGYIDKDYVYVYLEGKEVEDQLSYVWRNDNQIELSEPVDKGVKFFVRRIVPRDKLVNDYEDGAVLRESNLNDSYLQLLMIQQEIQDGFSSEAVEFLLNTNLNMNGYSIGNVGEPTSLEGVANLGKVLDLIQELSGQTIDNKASNVYMSNAESVEEYTIKSRQQVTALYKAQGYNDVFFFADGFTYTESNDVGIYEDGTAWTYADSGALPVTITAGTEPSEGAYNEVSFRDGNFNTLDEALSSSNINEGDVLHIKEIESGRGLAVYADVVSGETENEMTIFNHSSKPLQIKFRVRESKPQVAFMFDDAHVAHYTDVLPLFESYGFPLAFAICPRFTGEELNDTRMNTTQMLDAQKRGVEIINHSMTHANLASVDSLERAIAEIETARQWLENRGLNTVGYLAASSALNQEYLAAAKSRCAYALTIYANNDVETASIGAHSQPYSLSRLTMDGVASSATIARIKEAVKMGYSVMAYDHDAQSGSSSYIELNNVLSFANDNLDIFDVTLPRVLVSSRVGSLQDIPHYKKEEQIFNSTQGYQRSVNLGFGTQTNGVNKEITITPTATGTGTVTRDIDVLPNKSYTFSCNIRSGSAQMQISMGVICLDAANATIAGYTIETDKIDYDGNNQQRYGVEFHTPTNCAKVRIFWRITPLVIDGTTLLIREPAIYTGRRVLFELIEEEEETGFTFTEAPVNPDFTPDLDEGNSFFLRLDSSPCTINNPINGEPVEGLEKITFFIRANGDNRNLGWGSGYSLNPNTNYNPNSLGDLMIVSFIWYRGEWIQESNVAWI